MTVSIIPRFLPAFESNLDIRPFIGLVPRLLHSQTRIRTLKLCRQEEPGIFSYLNGVKGRKGLVNCARAYTRLRTAERAKAVGDLLYIYS